LLSLCWAYFEQETPSFFSYDSFNARNEKILPTSNVGEQNFNVFVKKALRFAFMKLIVSTPSLLRGLHTMSLAKSVPNGLKPCKCKCTKLREPPPIPYIPKKVKVQEEVARLRNLKIKTLLK
jgi:hypothetical protein